MKSTTAPAVTTEYTYTFSDNTTHIWNIRSSASPAAAAAAAAVATIEDFYIYEDMSSSNMGLSGHTQINKSFPCHHALVCASLGSTRELIARDATVAAGGCIVCRKRYTNDVAHATAYQKHHLVSMSGLAGLLVSRWMGVRGARPETIKSAKKHAELTAKYIHSALACEILIGNRYYRDLPRIIASSKIVGNESSIIMASFMPAELAPESVAATKTELLETYTAQIDRLTNAVRQYKRGFMSLQTIRSDPEFMRLMRAYWQYCNKLMKIHHREFEDDNCDSYDDTLDTRRIFISADICAVSAMVPQLHNYDIVHLLDNTKQSYAKFVKTTRQTLVRLANDGLTTAFLSFAVIEPRMLTAEMAPKHGMRHMTMSMMSCANHIPSRDPLLGALRVKHLHHLPRTADVEVCMRNYHPGHKYTPIQDTLEDIRAGRRRPVPIVITSATKAYAERQAAAAAADGWILCSRRKNK
jgi:hypothetical protein